MPVALLGALLLVSAVAAVKHFVIDPRRWMKNHGTTGLYGRSLGNKRASDSRRKELGY